MANYFVFYDFMINERMPLVQFQDKPSHNIVIEMYAPTINANEAKV